MGIQNFHGTLRLPSRVGSANIQISGNIGSNGKFALTGAAFLLGAPGAGAWGGGAPLHPATWSGFGLGLVTVLWAYNGWQDVTCLSGEVIDPGRALPRALVGGTLAVVAIYLMVNAAKW